MTSDPITLLILETSGSIVRISFKSALQNRRIARPAITTGLILLIQLVMTIVDRNKPEGDGLHWRPGGFVVVGALLFGAGFVYELLVSNMKSCALKLKRKTAVVGKML